MGDYLFPTLGFELGTSGSLVLHSTTVTWPSGFHLWQFQVFNSGVEGLVVVLFWLDLWDMFFSPTLGFGPGTSGYLILHSNTVPQWFLVFTSDTFRYLTLVQKKWWWYCSDCTCDQFSVSQHQVWSGYLWISSPALYHCSILTAGFHLWYFQVFNSGAEVLVVVLFWLDLWQIFFLPTPGFELGTSGSLVLHSTTVPWQLLDFTSDNFRYLTLVQKDWWWYCSDWTFETCSFHPHWGFNQGLLDL